MTPRVPPVRFWVPGALCLLVLAPLPAAPAGVNPAVRVQFASQLAHGTSVSVELSPTCENDLIVVGVMSTHPDPPPIDVTDNAPGGSNPYQLAAHISGPNHLYVFYAEGAKAGVTQVTATGSYGALDLIVAEYAGVAASGALDRVAARNNGYSPDHHWRTGWTPPTREALELLVVVGGGTYYAPSFVHRAGPGYNFVTTHAESGRNVSGLMMEDRVVATAGSFEGTGFTAMASGGKDIRYAVIATFRIEPSPLTYQCNGSRRGVTLPLSAATPSD